MSKDPLTISINAPSLLADSILGPRLPILKRRLPHTRVRLNAKSNPRQSATISLGLTAELQPGYASRKIGQISSQIYIHTQTHEPILLPDVVAGLDHAYTNSDLTQIPNVEELWLSVDKSSLHIPGIRQTLDWVESCLSSLLWLNETVPQQPPLSYACSMR
jgi:DNA-binding transcriptional LysR family regulator